MHIVIVTQCWPPRNAIGTFRPYSWAKYWSEAGEKVTVITSEKYAFDMPLDLDLPQLGGVEVIEVPYMGKSNWKNTLAQTSLGSKLKKVYRKLKSAGIKIEDPRTGWAQKAIPIAQSIAKSADVVVSTYTPEGSHVIANQMKASNPKIKWVADYRDLWSLDHITDRTEQEKIDLEKKEKSIASSADLITTVSKDLLNKQMSFLSKPGMVVMNGFDDEMDAVIKRHKQASQNDGQGPIVFVYTGRIYPKERDPKPLLDCLIAMDEAGKLKERSVEVHVYGDQVEYFEELAKDPKNSKFLRMKGYVSNRESRQAQQNADALLMLESPRPQAKGVVTGKLFEYIASGRPILSLGSRRDFAIGEIISETGIGVVAEGSMIKIEDFILMLMSNRGLSLENKNFPSIEKYSRKFQALKMLDAIKVGALG